MPEQIFDQDRPRSTMAQRLDEAFAGCDEWTVIVVPERRSTLNTVASSPPTSRIFDGIDFLPDDEPQAL